MKKKDLYLLRAAIGNCKNLTGAKFTYALSKNLRLIEIELKDIESARHKPSACLLAYSEAEKQLIESLAIKDENGKFMFENNLYTFKDKKFVSKAIEELQAKHPDAVEELKRANEDFEKLLNCDADFKPYTIDLGSVDNNITEAQMEGIFPLVEN